MLNFQLQLRQLSRSNSNLPTHEQAVLMNQQAKQQLCSHPVPQPLLLSHSLPPPVPDRTVRGGSPAGSTVIHSKAQPILSRLGWEGKVLSSLMSIG